MKPYSVSKVAPCRLLSDAYELVTFQGYVLTIAYLQQGDHIIHSVLHLIYYLCEILLGKHIQSYLIPFNMCSFQLH